MNNNQQSAFGELYEPDASNNHTLSAVSLMSDVFRISNTYIHPLHNKPLLRDWILLITGYFRFSSVELLCSLAEDSKSRTYIRARLLPLLLSKGLLKKYESGGKSGASLFSLTQQGLDYLKENGYQQSCLEIFEIMEGWSLSARENIRLHDYSLSIFLSSFAKIDLPIWLTYEATIRRRGANRTLYASVRPDVVTTHGCRMDSIPKFVYYHPNNLPSIRNKVFVTDASGNRTLTKCFHRRYFIEQDMGHETFYTLYKKLDDYYTKELNHLKFEPAYSSLVFSFAKPCAVKNKAFSVRTLRNLVKYMEEQGSDTEYTLKHFLHMDEAEKSKAVHSVGAKTFEKMYEAAEQLKTIRAELGEYHSTTNYNAVYEYPSAPIPMKPERKNYRSGFAYYKQDAFIDRQTFEQREQELLSNSPHIYKETDNEILSAKLDGETFIDESAVVEVDPPSKDFFHKPGQTTDWNMTITDIKEYIKELSNFQREEYVYYRNKIQYKFWSRRTTNFCKYLTKRIELFAAGLSYSSELDSIDRMLWGMDVISVPTYLADTKRYYLLPEDSGFLKKFFNSMNSYVNMLNGMFHYNYCFKAVSLSGTPREMDVEHDTEFTCLENIQYLTRVYPRYTFAFSFVPPENANEGIHSYNPSDDTEDSFDQLFCDFSGKNAKAYHEARLKLLASRYQKKTNTRNREEWGKDDIPLIDKDAVLKKINTPVTYKPPKYDHSPIKKSCTSVSAYLNGMYYVVMENISVDISGYIRMYYMCTFIKRPTNILLVCLVDTYTAAADFASNFPDLYVTNNPRDFSYSGLQLTFMLNSDVGAKRNALFRVGKDGSIYRINDFMETKRQEPVPAVKYGMPDINTPFPDMDLDEDDETIPVIEEPVIEFPKI